MPLLALLLARAVAAPPVHAPTVAEAPPFVNPEDRLDRALTHPGVATPVKVAPVRAAHAPHRERLERLLDTPSWHSGPASASPSMMDVSDPLALLVPLFAEENWGFPPEKDPVQASYTADTGPMSRTVVTRFRYKVDGAHQAPTAVAFMVQHTFEGRALHTRTAKVLAVLDRTGTPTQAFVALTEPWSSRKEERHYTFTRDAADRVTRITETRLVAHPRSDSEDALEAFTVEWVRRAR